ncbi:MAG: hypothetical protein K9G58_03435 [Bacteroidales bacterium]|nr:hypothetical protein [Bacteroidales bacterium]MCF8397195.1 hypothetical protein [Bacteroidales bacterium]
MNKISFSGKFLQGFFVLCLAILAFQSCDNDNDDSTIILADDSKISGQWEFTLSQDEVYIDTTEIKGKTEADFEIYNGMFSDVYLYESESGDIQGELFGYKISGKRNGKNVMLDLYIHPDGPYDAGLPLDDMALFSHMQLTINEFGYLNGNGTYYEYPEYPNITKDSYFVHARKLNDISVPEKVGSYWCHYFKVSSPYSEINNCNKVKDGGGYYLYGTDGPGLSNVMCATMYIPYEWELCKVRAYDFTVSYKTTYFESETVANNVISAAQGNTEINTLCGDPLLSPADFRNNLNDFWAQFGEFAFIIASDSYTNHASLYVIHTKGSADDVKNHIITKNITDYNPYFFDVLTGQQIQDRWHLKRVMDGLTCTDYLEFGYLFGTAGVNFN